MFAWNYILSVKKFQIELKIIINQFFCTQILLRNQTDTRFFVWCLLADRKLLSFRYKNRKVWYENKENQFYNICSSWMFITQIPTSNLKKKLNYLLLKLLLSFIFADKSLIFTLGLNQLLTLLSWKDIKTTINISLVW